MKQSVIIIFLAALITAFSPVPDAKNEYYDNLVFLKKASGPKVVEMIRTGNLGSGQPVIEKGVLFSYKSREALAVRIAGSFTGWRQVPMTRSKHAVWYYFYVPEKNDTVTYKFNVDGIWTSDPKNPDKKDDGAGSYLSLADTVAEAEGRRLTWRRVKKNVIEFRTFQPRARQISVVGDFNNWNPEHDLMARGRDGIWRLKKRVPDGTYRYKFVIDGKWEVDLYNPRSASDSVGELCSLIKVK